MKTLSEMLETLKKCSECQVNHLLFLTGEKISCCDKHWREIADSTIEWGMQ